MLVLSQQLGGITLSTFLKVMVNKTAVRAAKKSLEEAGQTSDQEGDRGEREWSILPLVCQTGGLLPPPRPGLRVRLILPEVRTPILP